MYPEAQPSLNGTLFYRAITIRLLPWDDPVLFQVREIGPGDGPPHYTKSLTSIARETHYDRICSGP